MCKFYYRFDNFPKTPYSFGRVSNIIDFLAIVWLISISITFFFPHKYPVTAENMNYTIVVVPGFCIIASLIWWLYGSDNYRKIGKLHFYPKRKRDKGVAGASASTSRRPFGKTVSFDNNVVGGEEKSDSDSDREDGRDDTDEGEAAALRYSYE